jgi:PAS domain S-box-containing protein
MAGGTQKIPYSCSECKKSEEALAASRAQIEGILESNHDGFLVLDKNWRIEFVNKIAAEILEIQPQSIIGQTLWEKFPKLKKSIFEESVRDVMQKKNAKSFEVNGIYSSGYYEVKVFPSNDDGISVLLKDISERKKSEEELDNYRRNLEKLVEKRTEEIRKSQQSYRELYESFDEAFIATDWELNVIHWNKAAERITTVFAKDALGKKIYDVLPEMSSVDVSTYFGNLAENKPVRFMMNTVSRQTGQNAMFEVSTYPSAQGIIIIVEDKTEEEQNKRLATIGQTAGMVGHDIRNPLQAIVSDIYLAKTELASMHDCEGKQNVQVSIAEIETNLSYISKIVADLQDFARPITAKLEEVDLEKTIHLVLANLKIPENITVSYTIKKDFPKLNADALFLQRILTNLANNALQAMSNGGKLTVAGFNENGKATITVTDTGEGIPENVKSKLFTPLVTTKAKGQGFGLAVVKRLTEGMGGKISFESQIGIGTKFIIELPI